MLAGQESLVHFYIRSLFDHDRLTELCAYHPVWCAMARGGRQVFTERSARWGSGVGARRLPASTYGSRMVLTRRGVSQMHPTKAVVISELCSRLLHLVFFWSDTLKLKQELQMHISALLVLTPRDGGLGVSWSHGTIVAHHVDAANLPHHHRSCHRRPLHVASLLVARCLTVSVAARNIVAFFISVSTGRA